MPCQFFFVLNRDVGFDVKTTLEQLGKCIRHCLARAGTILFSCSSCCAFGNVCNVFQFKSMTSLTLIAELLQEVFYFVDPEKLSELIAIGINVPFKRLDHSYFGLRLRWDAS